MQEQGFDWDKNEMRFVWTFTALFMYSVIAFLLNEWFIPFEWFWNALLDANLSFKDSYIMDLKEGLAEAQRILHDGK